jgi:hypothetical protein
VAGRLAEDGEGLTAAGRTCGTVATAASGLAVLLVMVCAFLAALAFWHGT